MNRPLWKTKQLLLIREPASENNKRFVQNNIFYIFRSECKRPTTANSFSLFGMGIFMALHFTLEFGTDSNSDRELLITEKPYTDDGIANEKSSRFAF